MNQASTDLVTAKGRRHAIRWVVPGLAATVVLGWGGWFVWLVAVEMRTASVFNDGMTLEFSYDDILGQDSFEASVRLIEERTGVPIEVRCIGYVPEARPDRRGLPIIGRRAGRAKILTPSAACGLLAESLGSALNQRIDFYAEGDHLVIATEDNVPRFQPVRKVRMWWYEVRAWWNSP